MFTGIITGIGHIESIEDAGDRTFRIGCDWDCSTIDIGASIACSGVCLTVVARHAHSFDVTASGETGSDHELVRVTDRQGVRKQVMNLVGIL